MVIGSIVVVVLVGGWVLCRAFAGCEGPRWMGNAVVEFRFSFDPEGSVAGTPIAVRRVDFTMRRDAARGSVRSVHSLVAGAGSAIDRSGWDSSTVVRIVHSEAPQWGEFLLLFLLFEEDVGRSEEWTVQCDAYRDAFDLAPTYPSRGEVAQRVTYHSGPDAKATHRFDFALQADGGIVGTVASPGVGAVVVLAFRYSGVNVTIARVLFVVSVDGGPDATLELTPTSPSPVAFAGGTAVRDQADHQAGAWQATVMDAGNGTWSVRCEAYTAAGNLRFPSGQSLTQPVSAPGLVDFAFTVKQGRAEPE